MPVKYTIKVSVGTTISVEKNTDLELMRFILGKWVLLKLIVYF